MNPTQGADGRVLGTRGIATRAALLEAVRTLAQRVDWREVSIMEAARSAGVSPAVFYTYFPTLEEAFDLIAPQLEVTETNAGRLAALTWLRDEEAGRTRRPVVSAQAAGDARIAAYRTRLTHLYASGQKKALALAEANARIASLEARLEAERGEHAMRLAEAQDATRDASVELEAAMAAAVTCDAAAACEHGEDLTGLPVPAAAAFHRSSLPRGRYLMFWLAGHSLACCDDACANATLLREDYPGFDLADAVLAAETHEIDVHLPADAHQQPLSGAAVGAHA